MALSGYLHQDYYFCQDSYAHDVDLVKGDGFSIYEIKSTQTIKTELFKEMDRFEKISAPAKVTKTLIYGGTENEKRSKYDVLGWRNITNK